MEEKINVKEFAEGYMNAKNKQTYLKKLQIVDYIDYNKKMFLCQKIVENTSYDENKNVQIDSPARYLLFIYTLLSSYTNLDVKGDRMLEDFDTLNKCGMIDEIIKLIKESEVNEFEKVLSMTYEDFITNHCGVYGIVMDLVKNVNEIIKGVSPELTQLVNDYLPRSG